LYGAAVSAGESSEAFSKLRLANSQFSVPKWAEPRGTRGQPVKDYRKAWATACEDAGLVAGIRGGLIPYDLQRSGLRNLVRAGVSETVAMGISGHRTRSTFDRYNITSAEDTRAALEAVSAWVQ
jgi:hypothetical protein